MDKQIMQDEIENQILFCKSFRRRGWEFFPYLTKSITGHKKYRLAVCLRASGPTSVEEIIHALPNPNAHSVAHEFHTIDGTNIVLFPDISYTPFSSRISIVSSEILRYLRLLKFEPKVLENADGRYFLGIVLKDEASIYRLGTTLTEVGLTLPAASIGHHEGKVVAYWPNLPVEESIIRQVYPQEPAT